MIPQASPGLRFARFAGEIEDRIQAVLHANHFILGPEVERFEAAFAGLHGVQHCIGVNSGTDAIALTLKGLGVGSGDEVITVAMTATGTAMGILLSGATPRFVDIDPTTRCIDTGAIEAAITTRTAAIVPVHLHGTPADMQAITSIAARHNLWVVEDCAQAHGATIDDRYVGTFAHAAAFSFYPTKNLGCVGDGGAVITKDGALAQRVKALRCYGWEANNRNSSTLGHNSRLDEIQAAILNVLLPHLRAGNDERRALAAQYHELLQNAGIELPGANPGAVHHQYAIGVPQRDRLRDRLRTVEGILTAVHYDNPLHRQPAFALYASDPLPNTDAAARTMLSLPIQPEVVDNRIPFIAKAVIKGLEQ